MKVIHAPNTDSDFGKFDDKLALDFYKALDEAGFVFHEIIFGSKNRHIYYGNGLYILVVTDSDDLMKIRSMKHCRIVQ